jgi:apolipoprotein D and lipocalin family protein
MSFKPILLALAGTAILAGCQSSRPPIETVDYVDLDRFMGDWYVIANIPTFFEKGAHNAVESYRLDGEGNVATTFTFRDGSFDGELKQYEPVGYVLDTDSNAVWAMQFAWLIKGDYRIIYLADDYSATVIGRNKRDYVWLMARQPEMPPGQYEEAVQVIADAGYDLSKLQRIPQRW